MKPVMNPRGKFAKQSIVMAGLLLMACGADKAMDPGGKGVSSLTVCNRVDAAIVLDAYATGSASPSPADVRWLHAPQLILEAGDCTRLSSDELGLDSRGSGAVMIEAFSRNGLRWGKALCQHRTAGSEYVMDEAGAESCAEGELLSHGLRQELTSDDVNVELREDNARAHSTLAINNQTDDALDVALMGTDPVTGLTFARGWYSAPARQTSRIVVHLRFVPYEGTLFAHARSRNQSKQWGGTEASFCVSDEPKFFLVDAASSDCHALEGQTQTRVVPSLAVSLKVGETATLNFSPDTASNP